MRKLYIASLAVVFCLILQGTALAQTNLRLPNVAQSTATVVKWTAGTVLNGGHAVTITAGTGSVTTSKSDCSSPSYAGCNFVYANSSGTVAITTNPVTAMASGNTLMAYVETSGSAITRIAGPQQASTAYLVKVNQSCGTTATCANTGVGAAGLIEAYGTVALSSASPSIASITQLPFTTSTSYVCTATPEGTTAAVAAGGIAINKTSGTAMTLTGPNTVTTVIDYRCIGN
jgi:hypothetical protein